MSARPPLPDLAGLSARIDALAVADIARLRLRVEGIRRMPPPRQARKLRELTDRVARAERRVVARRAAMPEIRYPSELPVSARVGELAAAIRDHQVVVVAGETGSGKSTQIPKICLQLGRGVTGTIGHTQPRRIAARALAERIAQETGTVVGAAVGYAVRFGDHTSERTLVKLMTDGILLAEIASDPELLRYDTIIIDEAHERSLNIDFLLGYLSELLPRRPDLKVIITSATIDPDKFSRHFGGAPVIEVSGRSFPIEIRYRPYGVDAADTGDADGAAVSGRTAGDDAAPGPGSARAAVAPPRPVDQQAAILRAVDELTAAGPGDVLVFLSGEREIRDTEAALRAHLQRRGGLAAETDVLPLFGRLSMADQHKVFAPTGRRRIVLATNVAETSLTVPGIRYVIDPGTARISRYSTRTKVQRLPIERVSQASAGQRAGRCGRVADGICIRLYSEADFAGRPEFTDPEIARTSLASVILQMAALGLGDIERFPFIDPPATALITDGLTVLRELGALRRPKHGSGGRKHKNPREPNRGPALTGIGRKLAALPVDPRLARIIVAGADGGALDEILIIVSALAIRDVREYPVDDRDRAAAYHSRFADETSDFLAYVSLWHYLARQGKELSGNKFRKMCQAEYLHFLRIREWQDLHAQLRRAAAELGLAESAGQRAERGAAQRRKGGGARGPGSGKTRPNGDNDQPRRGSEAVPVNRAAVHTALATGLLSHIGSRMERDRRRGNDRGSRPGPREYQGTRGSTFAIWPGSVLAKTGAPMVLAAEMVETSRLYARTVAAVDPVWIEKAGGSLLRRQHADPYFSPKRNAVMSSERVTLLGVTLVESRLVAYDSVDPAAARDLLIRRGLVEGELTLPLPFLRANQEALDEVAESERRARRGGIVADDETLFTLYDQQIPEHVTSGKRLEDWWRRESRHRPGALHFTPDMLIAAGADLADRAQYPDQLDAQGVPLELSYTFEPGAVDDGVSATVPLASLAAIDPSALPTQVPGHRRELTLALIKSLPKQLRRHFVPAPDVADTVLAAIGDDLSALPQRLADQLSRVGGTRVTTDDFDYNKVPGHLRMRLTVVDDEGVAVAQGTDVTELQRALAIDTRRAVAQAAELPERAGVTTFPPEGLPRTTSGGRATGYPALTDDGESTSIRIFTSEADQQRAMRRGTRRLVALALTKDITALANQVRRLAVPKGPSASGAGRQLGRGQLMRLSAAPHGSLDAVVADAADATIDALLSWAGGPAWGQEEFTRLCEQIRRQLGRGVMDVLSATADVLAADAAADAAIGRLATSRRVPEAGMIADELRAERDSWLGAGFISAVGAAHLPDVTRYLTALTTRAERVITHPDRDREHSAEIAELAGAVAARLDVMPAERRSDDDVLALRRLLAEYRIGLFAQPMKTAVPVSAKRIRKAIAALHD